MSSNQPKTGAWCSERLRAVFEKMLAPEFESDALELVKNRKVLDFLLMPGQVSAKIEREDARPQRVVIVFPTFSDEQWDNVLLQLAESAYFLAKLLAGEFPREIEVALHNAGVDLFPQSSSQLEITLDGKKEHKPSVFAAAMILRLLSEVDRDPFSLFIILGRGREETLAELRRIRLQRSEAGNEQRSITGRKVQYQPAPPLAAGIDRFWNFDPSLSELHYSIKADELPASILKWLDAIPLGGLEEEIDYLLEEAYARIARLAQSYGLGL